MNILIHPTMTVMTDDSFRKLRGRELLVNIYYNIYLLILITHRFSISVICHLSSQNRQKPLPCPLSTKRKLKGSIITTSRPRNYGLFKFVKFVLKSPQIEGQNLEAHDIFCTFAVHLKMHCEWRLRLSIARASSALHIPDQGRLPVAFHFALHFAMSKDLMAQAGIGHPM